MTMNDFIPVNTPLLDGNERKYLNECVDTGWISSEGPFVNKFEHHFSESVQREYGVAVCNGTVALEVAVVALGLGSGDEIILPSFTIISCAAAIVRSGAVPIVVDCDPITWNIDVMQIESKITSKTRAIMVVHIYGLPVDMEPVLNLAEKYSLKIIEDSAQMIGQTYRGRSCGSFGDISTFSFYPNKHITTGEGGMIVTDNSELAEKCRSLRNLCFQNGGRRFVHEELGWNFRMTNLQAALGLAQLERLSVHVVKKRWMGRLYTELLKDVSGVQLPLPGTEYAENIYWVYGLVLKDDVSFNAMEMMENLAEYGIGTRPFFWPIHEQPALRKMDLFKSDTCPVAERISRRGFYIPSGLTLNEEQIVKVAQTIIKMLDDGL